MPRTRTCDYCGGDIEPGTGTLFVRSNGASVYFCSAKCEKNANLGREARDLEWTAAGQRGGDVEPGVAPAPRAEPDESPVSDVAAAEADDAASPSVLDSGDDEPDQDTATAQESPDQTDADAGLEETADGPGAAESAADEGSDDTGTPTDETTPESDEPVDTSNAEGSEDGDTESGESDEEAEA